MSRYTIQVENESGQDYFDVIYGFDTGGLLGQRSPTFGFFLQAWLIVDGVTDLTYNKSGCKLAIIESPFWDEIVKLNPDHSMKIALDLPF